MFLKVVTTITSLVDVDSLKPEHSVSIEADGVPENVARMVAVGAARSLLTALGEGETEDVGGPE